MTVFVGCPTDRVRMLGEKPKVYGSSPGVKRSFCGNCGASLAYEDEKLPREIYLAVGVLDEPEKFEPQCHSWFSRKLGWLHLEDDAPRHQKSSRPR